MSLNGCLSVSFLASFTASFTVQFDSGDHAGSLCVQTSACQDIESTVFLPGEERLLAFASGCVLGRISLLIRNKRGGIHLSAAHALHS